MITSVMYLFRRSALCWNSTVAMSRVDTTSQMLPIAYAACCGQWGSASGAVPVGGGCVLRPTATHGSVAQIHQATPARRNTHSTTNHSSNTHNHGCNTFQRPRHQSNGGNNVGTHRTPRPRTTCRATLLPARNWFWARNCGTFAIPIVGRADKVISKTRLCQAHCFLQAHNAAEPIIAYCN